MPAFLKPGYRVRKHSVTEGVARTGEVSPKGTVTHIEDWDGRVAAQVLPGTQRWIIEDGRLRAMTFAEMVERGYFVLGKGPQGHGQGRKKTR